MENEIDIVEFPDWILKILPVLTGNLSLRDFEQWLYLPQSENYFPEEVYSEFISFDYGRNLSDFFDFIQVILPFESRDALSSILSVLQAYKPRYLSDWELFTLLPVSERVLEFIWDRIYEQLDNIYESELCENYENAKKYHRILVQYLEKVVFLLSNYEEHTELSIRRELNKIFLSKNVNILKGIG